MCTTMLVLCFGLFETGSYAKKPLLPPSLKELESPHHNVLSLTCRYMKWGSLLPQCNSSASCQIPDSSTSTGVTGCILVLLWGGNIQRRQRNLSPLLANRGLLPQDSLRVLHSILGARVAAPLPISPWPCSLLGLVSLLRGIARCTHV